MELFRNTNIDFLGKKKYFLVLSALLLIAGFVSLARKGMPWGVDFKGGTLVYVKFAHAPQADKIRATMQQAGLPNARIQQYGKPENHEVIIALEQHETSEEALDRGRNQIIQALQGPAPEGRTDLNNAGAGALAAALLERDPLRAGTTAEQRYNELARQVADIRDREMGGVLGSFDQLKGRVPDPVVAALQQSFFLSDFTVRNVEIVGAQVTGQLKSQALFATMYASLGMLVYLAFRFQLIYGLAAVVAIVHDVAITLGIFSLTNKEISLTVIAALLTLIGYSMNDTIVIFDRVRENLRLMRRERFAVLVNKSINDTLSRTVLTTGLTFITVVALWLWGGEVLNGFSFVLVIGILVGTYSSFAVAAPLVVAYMERKEAASGRAPAAAESRKNEKVRAKA